MKKVIKKAINKKPIKKAQVGRTISQMITDSNKPIDSLLKYSRLGIKQLDSLTSDKIPAEKKPAIMKRLISTNSNKRKWTDIAAGRKPMPKQKMGGVTKKAKSGGSFPDLNKDGKITKADILKGRGVIAKKGAALKKQAAVAITMKKAGKAPKKMQYGGAAASMVPPMMKKGGATKKCKYGCK